MAQTITKGIKALLAEANKVVTTIPLDEAKALVDSDRHVLERQQQLLDEHGLLDPVQLWIEVVWLGLLPNPSNHPANRPELEPNRHNRPHL